MALVKCNNCGASISDKAETCPKCGARVSLADNSQGAGDDYKGAVKNKSKSIFVIIPIIIIVLLAIFAIFRSRLVSVITIEESELYLGIGDKGTIEYTIYPAFAATSNLDWYSENPNVALVNKGLVTGVGEGITAVKVETPNGKQASCKVTVASLIDEWEWNFTYVDGKKYTSDGLSSKFLVEGNNCSFTDATGDTYTGTWKYEGIIDGVEVYFFDADGSLDFNITISDDSLTVSPELSNAVVIFFNRQ